jgi:hypothetical protein
MTLQTAGKDHRSGLRPSRRAARGAAEDQQGNHDQPDCEAGDVSIAHVVAAAGQGQPDDQGDWSE